MSLYLVYIQPNLKSHPLPPKLSGSAPAKVYTMQLSHVQCPCCMLHLLDHDWSLTPTVNIGTAAAHNTEQEIFRVGVQNLKSLETVANSIDRLITS